MKKLAFLFVAAIAFASCGNKAANNSTEMTAEQAIAAEAALATDSATCCKGKAAADSTACCGGKEAADSTACCGGHAKENTPSAE